MNHKLTHSSTVQFDTHVSQGMALPRPAVQGLASGIFFLAFFGAFWGLISAVNMSATIQAVAFLLVGLVTLFFFIIGVMLLRYASTLPKLVSQEDKALGKRIALWFGIIFGIEFVLIALASTLLSTFNVGSFYYACDRFDRRYSLLSIGPTLSYSGVYAHRGAAFSPSAGCSGCASAWLVHRRSVAL